jgi:predicted permease
MLERLKMTPGVEAAAVTNAVPMANIQPGERPVRIEGVTVDDASQLPLADQNVGSEEYFDALRIPVVRGRLFRASDDQDAPAVAVINESMERLWGERDPVGLRFEVSGTERWITVIGVVADMRQYSVEREALAQFFTPFLQTPGIGARVLVRTSGSPMDLVPALKAAVYAAHPEVPVERIQTLESLRAGRLASPGLNAALLALFAGLALVITLAGLAAVIGAAVSQRAREFGLRMALGATRQSVLVMVLRQGLTLVVAGLAAGAAGALILSRAMVAYLYETAPTDPVVYLIVAALFVAAATVACLGPARRATSIDPLLALKAE